MTHFDTLEYLKSGTPKQQEAYGVLTTHAVLDHLRKCDPLLVGTIPINIDVEDSDLDIICFSENSAEFKSEVTKLFGKNFHFSIQEMNIREIDSIVVNFQLDRFQVELFAQPIPTRLQAGYRHMIIEHMLLEQKGKNFRDQIIELKKKGYKTEPAFAELLGLKGDPYEALLNFERGA